MTKMQLTKQKLENTTQEISSSEINEEKEDYSDKRCFLFQR